MTPNDDRLEVRVDPAFKARLKAAAKADHRSLSSFVISRLEAALSSSETPEPAREGFDHTAAGREQYNALEERMARQQALNDAKAKKR